MEQNHHDHEIEELEQSLRRMEHDLQAHYQEMGKTLLEVADQQQKEVNKLVDDIISTRKQLSLTRDELECDDCLAFNPRDAQYCKRCGKKLSPSEREGES